MMYTKIFSWPFCSFLLFFFLALTSWTIVLKDSDILEFFSGGSLNGVLDNFRHIYNSQISGQSDPAFLSFESWYRAVFLSFRTLLVSILAIGLAGFVALLTLHLAQEIWLWRVILLSEGRFQVLYSIC